MRRSAEARTTAGGSLRRSRLPGGAVGRMGTFALLLGALALSLGACGGASYRDNPFDASGAGEQSVRITIRNQNFNDATIRVIWSGGSRERLGSVTGNSSRTFTTRFRSDRLSLEVDFLAGGSYRTRSVGVSPGEHLQMDIRPN